MGRNPFPWWNQGKKCWYVYRGGNYVRLHPDREEAFRLWHRMELGLEAGPARGPTVGQIVDAYLLDAEGRLIHEPDGGVPSSNWR